MTTIANADTMPSATRGYWLPIGSTSAMDTTLPSRVVVAGNTYVVWRNLEEVWSVMDDACPHRLAPLSQGRVDTNTGCLQCPYHGWEFNANGKCTKIPQLDEKCKGLIPKGTDGYSLPVHTTGDILWAFVPFITEGKAINECSLPDEIFPILSNISSPTTRELPYSFDFLIENFMDPAHVPFAHHSLQGVRSDGSPIPMKALTTMNNSTHCEVEFKDVIRGKSREGVVSFTPPCYYHLRVKDTKTGLYRMPLMILATPGSDTFFWKCYSILLT